MLRPGLLLGRQSDLAPACSGARAGGWAIKTALGGSNPRNQVQPHERLLSFLASSLATLAQDLIAANLWDDVVVMTYSEFGRRAKQNASGGTDHGTAAPIFVMAAGVKAPLRCLSVAQRPADGDSGTRSISAACSPPRHRAAGPAARLRPAPTAQAGLPHLGEAVTEQLVAYRAAHGFDADEPESAARRRSDHHGSTM